MRRSFLHDILINAGLFREQTILSVLSLMASATKSNKEHCCALHRLDVRTRLLPINGHKNRYFGISCINPFSFFGCHRNWLSRKFCFFHISSFYYQLTSLPLIRFSWNFIIILTANLFVQVLDKPHKANAPQMLLLLAFSPLLISVFFCTDINISVHRLPD